MKSKRVRYSRELLGRFEKGEDFLKIVTGDETWVHHYDPENKSPWNTAIRKLLSKKKIQNTGLDWKGHVFLEFGTCSCSFLKNKQ
jgi:hypothetical protein